MLGRCTAQKRNTCRHEISSSCHRDCTNKQSIHHDNQIIPVRSLFQSFEARWYRRNWTLGRRTRTARNFDRVHVVLHVRWKWGPRFRRSRARCPGDSICSSCYCGYSQFRDVRDAACRLSRSQGSDGCFAFASNRSVQRCCWKKRTDSQTGNTCGTVLISQRIQLLAGGGETCIILDQASRNLWKGEVSFTFAHRRIRCHESRRDCMFCGWLGMHHASW